MAYLLAAMVILYTFQSLFCRLYGASGGSAMRFSIGYSLFAGVATLAVSGFRFSPSASTLWLGAANALVLFTYNLAMVKAGNLGSYAFMMVSVLSGGIILPMIYDLLFVSGTMTALRVIAAAIMIISFVLMNKAGISGKKSVRYLVLCAVLFIMNGLYGVLMFIQQDMNGGAQRGEMIIITFLGTALIALIAELARTGRGFFGSLRMKRPTLIFMLISALSATIAVNLLMYVISRVNLTVMNVVNNGGVFALSAVFAILLFKEKPDVWRVSGIILACASIVLLCI